MKIFKLTNSKENLENLELFKEWGILLMERKDEVIKTLVEENLLLERVSLAKSDKELYLICESVVKDGKTILPSNKERVLNRVHKRIWDQLEKELAIEIPDFESQTILYEVKVE